MINQYFENSYGSIPSDVINVVSNKVHLLDKYIIMQTGQNEYTALIQNCATKRCKQYVFSRSSSSYNNYYTVADSDGAFEYNVSNEYYVYSNVGLGKSVSLPVHQGVTAYSLCILVCVLSLAIMFKGVLFKWLRLKR